MAKQNGYAPLKKLYNRAMKASYPRQVFIFILILIDVALLVVLGLQVVHRISKPNDSNKQASSKSSTENPDTPPADVDGSSSPNEGSISLLARNGRNVQRKNDASQVLGIVAEYINNNNGQMPTMIIENQLRGDAEDDYPSDIPPLDSYPTISLSNSQEQAVTSDQLILVIGATCADDGSAVIGISRSAAALYGLENANGTFTGTCASL